MKDDAKKIIKAFRRYASEQGWTPEDYRLLMELVPDWGRIHILLLVRKFVGNDGFETRVSVFKSLEATLADDPRLIRSINFVAHSFDQVKEGGIYAVSPVYIDADELFAVPSFG